MERLGAGHGAVVLLNMPQPVDANPSRFVPMDVAFCRQAREQGGFVDGEKPIWKNVPVNLAFGALDSIGVVNNHFHPHDVLLDAEKYGSIERGDPAYGAVEGFARWMLDLYYSFLNCGFRIPVSAGSASARRRPPVRRCEGAPRGGFVAKFWEEATRASTSRLSVKLVRQRVRTAR